MRSSLEDYSGDLKKRVLETMENGIVLENDLQFEDAKKELEIACQKLKKGQKVLIIEGEIIAPDDNWDRVLFKERDKVFEEVVAKYVKTSHKKIQKSIRNINKKPYEQILEELGFKKVKKSFYEKEIKRSEYDLIEWIYKNTIFEKARFNGKEKEFEEELKKRWQEINPEKEYREKAVWRVWSAIR